MAVDNTGHIYLTGTTYGDLGGITAGKSDAWVAKYDVNGNQVWIQQFGTPGYDSSDSVTVARAGNIYLTGSTNGDFLDSTKNASGGNNAWVAKYDANGNQVWIQQLETSGLDFSNSVEIDPVGDIYLTGSVISYSRKIANYTSDPWVTQYDAKGNKVSFKRSVTDPRDGFSSIAVDSVNNLYLSGTTYLQDSQTQASISKLPD